MSASPARQAFAAARAVARALGFAAIVSGFAVLCLAAHAFSRTPSARQRRLSRVSSRAAALLGPCLGLRLRRVDLAPPPPEGTPTLIVSNHLSYLEAVVFAALRPVRFVTSVEVRDSFFLGHLARLAGCLFVERRSRAGIGRETSEITRSLALGSSVVLFPEGTSTNGETVLPFKRSLIDCARLSGREVELACVRYLSVEGQPFGPANRDRLCYYGDLRFLPHFLGLLTMDRAEIEVRFLGRLAPWQAGPASEAGTDGGGFAVTVAVAEEAHRRIRDAYSAPRAPSPGGEARVPESVGLGLQARAHLL